MKKNILATIKVGPVLAASLLVGLTANASEKSETKPTPARVQQSPFGKMPDGTSVELYTLTNAKGMVVKVITYGAIMTELTRPTAMGRWPTSSLASTT